MEDRNKSANELVDTGTSCDAADELPLVASEKITQLTDANPRTALVFEFSDGGADEFRNDSDISADERLVTPSVNEAEPDLEVPLEPVDGSSEYDEYHIDLPESLEEQISSTYLADAPYNIRTTYVPTFTEVSDTYRMKDDPRPRQDSDGVIHIAERHASSSDGVSLLHPTAEIGEESKIERVIVTGSTEHLREPVDEKLKVYKFKGKDGEQAREIPTVDELHNMTDAYEKNESASEDAQPDEQPVKQSGKYVMPDPEGAYRRRDSELYIYRPAEPRGAGKPLSDNDALATAQARDATKDRLLDSLISVRVRFIALLLLLIGSVITEMFIVDILGVIAVSNTAVACAAIDLTLCACAALISIPELVLAIKKLMRGKASSEQILLLGAVVMVAYGTVIMIFGAVENVLLSVFYCTLSATAVLGSLLRSKACFVCFRMASKNAQKSVIDIRNTRELPSENKALDGVVDEYNSKTARMFATDSVSEFEHNLPKDSDVGIWGFVAMAVSVCIALAVSIISFFVGGWELADAARSFVLVFMLSCPAVSLINRKLHFLTAEREAESEGGSFIGEGALDECAAVDVLCYDDTEVFGEEDVSIRNVHLYGKMYNMPKAMNQMYSLFSVVGGPLDRVFSAALDRKCESATSVVIEPDGVRGMLEGHSIYAGSEEFMLRHGLVVPTKVGTSAAAGSTRIMYGAEDGEVYVRFTIRYSFSEEFSMLLPHIKAEGVTPLIYTADPNINLELVRVLTFGEDIIRVMKKDVPQAVERKKYSNLSSVMLTYGGKASAFGMLSLAKRYSRTQAFLSVAETAVMLVGSLTAAVVGICGAFWLPMWALALLHPATAIAVSVKGYLVFKDKKKRGN